MRNGVNWKVLLVEKQPGVKLMMITHHKTTMNSTWKLIQIKSQFQLCQRSHRKIVRATYQWSKVLPMTSPKQKMTLFTNHSKNQIDEYKVYLRQIWKSRRKLQVRIMVIISIITTKKKFNFKGTILANFYSIGKTIPDCYRMQLQI